MSDSEKHITHLRIKSADDSIPIELKLFAVFCLDDEEVLINDKLLVSNSNTESPNGEIRFVKSGPYEEEFLISLDDFSDEVHQIVVLVDGVNELKSDLIFETYEDDNDYKKTQTISRNSADYSEKLIISRYYLEKHDYTHSYSFESVSESYYKWLLGSWANDEYEICSSILSRQYEVLEYKTDNLNEDLDYLVRISDEVAEIKKKLERIAWDRVPEEKKTEIRNEISKHITSINAEFDNELNDVKKECDSLCDEYEHHIFTILSFKNKYKRFEKEYKELATKRLMEYRDFTIYIKEKCGFERTQEQKLRRTEKLKQFE